MRKSVIALSILSIFLSNTIHASEMKSIKIGGYIIPPAFVSALEEGMSVPVFLRLSDDAKKTRAKIKSRMPLLSLTKVKLNYRAFNSLIVRKVQN